MRQINLVHRVDMRFNYLLVLPILLFIIFATQAYMDLSEGFAATSTGTMIQLRTSHVDNEEDEENRRLLPYIIDHDLQSMTGGGLFD
jgi:hypothetical protein